MQDQKNTKTPPTSPADPVKTMDAMVGRAAQGDFVQKIVEKIKNSENILIALSRDPSVDEIAAAIGLTMYLDSMQKHAMRFILVVLRMLWLFCNQMQLLKPILIACKILLLP